MHWDHIGGLDALLAGDVRLTVFIPESFSPSFIRDVRARAQAVVLTSRACQVTPGVWTTDVLQGGMSEQALCVGTEPGLVVVTGCAHPGVVPLVRAAKEFSGRRVHAVLGGFHLASATQRRIAKVIRGLKELGVQRAGPCHCSGDAARARMREAFGKDYIEAGVGFRLSLPLAAGEDGG